MSFQIAIAPNRRAATRFIGKVRRGLRRALADKPEISRSQVAESIGVHRSVITKQLNGHADMSLGRVAEIAWAMGLKPSLTFNPIELADGSNLKVTSPPAYETKFRTSKSSANDVVVVRGNKTATKERVLIEVEAL